MIEARGLRKWFGSTPVLEDVSFKLERGQTAVISGPSGSGKTTLLRLLAGLELPDSGEVHLDGELASTSIWLKPPHQRGIGFAFQSSALWPHMTVAQNVAFGIGHKAEIDKKKRLAEVLEQAGLNDLAHNYPSQLSGGQARRASLARTLAPCPRILLLDEPLVYLDPQSVSDMLAWINAEVQRCRMTVIWVSHNLEDLSEIQACRYRMAGGKLLTVDGGAPR